MRATRRSRSLLALGLTALMLLAPVAASAQAPSSDAETRANKGENFIARMGDWYLTAKVWRDQMLEKGRWMFAQTQKAEKLRSRYEDKARGELGILGGSVPDWRKYANTCAIKADGVTACNWQGKLTDKFESVLSNTMVAYEDSALKSSRNITKTLNGLVGHGFASAADFARSKRGGPGEANAQMVQYEETAAMQGDNLDIAAQELNELVDSLVASEINGVPLSSTRAAQLNAHVGNVQTKLDIEISRAHARNLELGSLMAANAVREIRVDRYTVKNSFGR